LATHLSVQLASVCLSFSLTDLFIVGLGFDITGALLLVRGLLISPATIARLGTWGGLETGDTLDRCKNRVDALFGGFSLLLGFFLQAVGYTLEIGGAEGATGGNRVGTAILLGLLSVMLSLTAYRASRVKLLKRTLVAVAKSREGSGDLGDEKGPQWTRQKVIKLAKLAEAAGWPREDSDEDGITRVNYIRRVFGVEVPRFPCDEPGRDQSEPL
jgi:hypothetical protein